MHNMNRTSTLRSISVAASILAIGILCAVCPGSNACTIFVLADSNHAFFFNNEDWSNPVTRIWFAPAGTNYFAAVYVGFDNPRTTGRSEQGALTAAPIFRDFMKDALADQPPTPFRVPPGISFAPQRPTWQLPDGREPVRVSLNESPDRLQA